MTVDVRPYDPADDRAALWALKRAFERELGAETGGDEKARAYEEKLTPEYRERYLAWVDRCAANDPETITVAVDGDDLVGYVFVLPESHALIWDAAVLNELYLETDHRGTGVADDLLEAALACARGQDLPMDRIVLDVDPDNDRAQGLYSRHGFETWGELVMRSL